MAILAGPRAKPTQKVSPDSALVVANSINSAGDRREPNLLLFKRRVHRRSAVDLSAFVAYRSRPPHPWTSAAGLVPDARLRTFTTDRLNKSETQPLIPTLLLGKHGTEFITASRVVPSLFARR